MQISVREHIYPEGSDLSLCGKKWEEGDESYSDNYCKKCLSVKYRQTKERNEVNL